MNMGTSELLTNKQQLHKYGYCVVRNLFSGEDVENYKSTIRAEHQNESILSGLHNYKGFWDLIVNRRLLNVMRYLIGPDIYYLYNSSSTIFKENQVYHSWHRDSACRIFGKGADWDKNESYNVLRVAIYLSSFSNTGSGINIIPESNKKRYTLSNLLRLLHYKTKKVSILNPIRRKISKYVGLNIQVDPGDCILFFQNLLHSSVPTYGTRESIFLSYGTNNKHSKNFVNYYMKHRKGYEMSNEEMRNKFVNLLKSKNIYFPIPERKEEINGLSIPEIDR